MGYTLLQQFFALSLYALFMGFSFCDGFKLHTGKKLIWFAVFLGMAISSLQIYQEYNLTFILPIPTALAIILCAFEKMMLGKKNP